MSTSTVDFGILSDFSCENLVHDIRGRGLAMLQWMDTHPRVEGQHKYIFF